jgi:periplasmic protein TonB
MFDDCLVESRVGDMSVSRRWTTAASIALQVALAGVVIVLPLLHPAALRFSADVPKILLPVLTKPRVVVVQASTAAASVAGPSVIEPSVVASRSLVLQSLLLRRGAGADEAPVLAQLGSGMGGSGVPDVIGSGRAESVSCHGDTNQRAPGAVHVSTGVLQGMLLAPIRPVYPAIAKAAHVEGSVVVNAVISRTGTIESLHVLSGPTMLQGAAIDAIRTARYQPYRLNGEPTEVQIAITVNFRMG